MLKYNSNNHQLNIIIPITELKELHNYQRGILGVLREVDINNCNDRLKENLKSVYQLLGHLIVNEDVLKSK